MHTKSLTSRFRLGLGLADLLHMPKSFTVGDLGWLITVFFISVVYLTPIDYFKTSLVWFILVAILGISRLTKSMLASVFSQEWLPLGLLSLLSLFLYVLNPFGGSYAIRLAATVVGLYIILKFFDCKPSMHAVRLLYYIQSITITILFVIYFVNPSLFYNISVEKPLEIAPVLYGAADKNWTAVFVFLYFVLALKLRKGYGIALGLLYPIIYLGRQYMLMVVILFIILFLSRKDQDKARIIRRFGKILSKPSHICIAFLLLGFLCALFSKWWVNEVIPMGMSAYKNGLNDPSNAMRFASIDYVVNYMLRDPLFILRGLDSSLSNTLGIVTDATLTYRVDGLYRLVQPHNETINLIVREGLLFTVIYYYCIAVIIKKIPVNRMNIALLTSFFCGSFILHQMFSSQTLLLFIFVFFVPWTENTSQKEPKF